MFVARHFFYLNEVSAGRKSLLCFIMLKFKVFKHLLEVSKKNVIYFEELTLKAPVMVITDVVVMSRNTACTCEG